MEEWDPDRAGDLSRLLVDTMPGEDLTADELQSICWDDPGGLVLGASDGSSAVAGIIRQTGPMTTGFVRLLAVHPGSRRQRTATALLGAMEKVLIDRGATQLQLAGDSPRFVWPGVDTRWTAALCLAEALGYSAVGSELNMSCPTTYRAPVPAGIELTRVVDDDHAAAVVAFATEVYPWWVDELQRGIEQGGVFGAFESGDAVGFGCHSVNRDGWVGPMATDPAAQRRGVGAALLGELCRDLVAAGHNDAEICWVGPISFYAKTAGASVSRVFRVYRKAATHI